MFCCFNKTTKIGVFYIEKNIIIVFHRTTKKWSLICGNNSVVIDFQKNKNKKIELECTTWKKKHSFVVFSYLEIYKTNRRKDTQFVLFFEKPRIKKCNTWIILRCYRISTKHKNRIKIEYFEHRQVLLFLQNNKNGTLLPRKKLLFISFFTKHKKMTSNTWK